MNFSDEMRFWSKVLVGDSCWEWTGTKVFGYGKIKIKGKILTAHRVSYELMVGKIPDGLVVRHNVCNNKSCVNPSHLLVGTQQDNIDDKRKFGTLSIGLKNGAHTKPDKRPRGIRHGSAKLNIENIAEIKNMWNSGQFTKTDISKLFGVNRTTITRVITGRNWKAL